jgi:hypothetical protein
LEANGPAKRYGLVDVHLKAVVEDDVVGAIRNAGGSKKGRGRSTSADYLHDPVIGRDC